MVEQRALSNVGDPYHLSSDNCEHDMTFAQTGIPNSSTVNASSCSARSSASVRSWRTSPNYDRDDGGKSLLVPFD